MHVTYLHWLYSNSPLTSEIFDGVVDVNVKCKHLMIAGYVMSQSESSRGCDILKVCMSTLLIFEYCH